MLAIKIRLAYLDWIKPRILNVKWIILSAQSWTILLAALINICFHQDAWEMLVLPKNVHAIWKTEENI